MNFQLSRGDSVFSRLPDPYLSPTSLIPVYLSGSVPQSPQNTAANSNRPLFSKPIEIVLSSAIYILFMVLRIKPGVSCIPGKDYSTTTGLPFRLISLEISKNEAQGLKIQLSW